MTQDPPLELEQQVHRASRQRDRVDRSLRLLRKMRLAAEAGEPVPSLEQLALRTGLKLPGPLPLIVGLRAMVAAMEAERTAIHRRLRALRERHRRPPSVREAEAEAAEAAVPEAGIPYEQPSSPATPRRR